MHLFDRLRFLFYRYKNWRANSDFLRQYPDVAFPPDYLLYESFGLDYKRYYEGGRETAEWLATLLNHHISLSDVRILDWGCGPGRIIRHFEKFVGQRSSLHGTDYNQQTINWCKQHLPAIAFTHNSTVASLPFANGYFDIIYGISVITHLPDKSIRDWYIELCRILKPGGILFLTSQGNSFVQKLSREESAQFAQGKLIVRGRVTEGHRVFSTFHPPQYMIDLFAQDSILAHIEKSPRNQVPIQDVWIVRKHFKKDDRNSRH